MCVSHLKVLPLSVLVLVTVCDNDSGICSFSEALVILHQLVGFIDPEQLHKQCTKKPNQVILSALLIL